MVESNSIMTIILHILIIIISSNEELINQIRGDGAQFHPIQGKSTPITTNKT